jgi:hypothetical protein
LIIFFGCVVLGVVLPQSIADAVSVVCPGGKIVAAGTKGCPADGIPIDELVMKEVTIEGVRGAGPDHHGVRSP